MKSNYMLKIAVEIPEVTLEDFYSLFVHDELLRLHGLVFLYSQRIPCLIEDYS